MRFHPTTTALEPEDKEATPLRTLVETAMQQAQHSPSDIELIAKQLAGELNKIKASLSDVRGAVQDLYQGDRQGAEDYLRYLAQHGFPKTDVTTQRQAVPTRSIDMQDQAISNYQSDAYGQIVEGLTDSSQRFYGGNLIAELVANSAFSALIFGERRSGTSAILRAILYDQIDKSGRTILDILDLHNGQWRGLEDIRLPDGEQMVTYLSLSTQEDIEAFASRLSTVAAEVRRRQQLQRNTNISLSAQPLPTPYLFLIDGLSEVRGALPGWRADRRSKDALYSRAASSLRVVLCHGPAVGISCVATARDHSSCLCDATALGETKLLFLGRVSAGRNGGYRAIDRAIEDKELLPSPHDRTRYRELLSMVKQMAQPVVFTPNGIPRLGQLGDFSGYLSVDLLMHYQQALEVQSI